MKTIILILLGLVANVFSAELFLVNISDTLENKGDNELDSSSHVIVDSSNVSDSLELQPTINKSLFIDAMENSSNSSYSNSIKHKEYSIEDYRNLSDIFTYMPFGFAQDLGSLGQPNEQMFYGLGFSNISYNRDGVLLNNRWQNSYDLNKLNSERIDSLEVVPLTRGFLYSTYNNPVSVNMQSRFNFPSRAITRLKFYQASYDEGFIDVLFHTQITSKLNFGIGVSNSAIDSRFENSDYESWKLDAKIAYLLNDKINITANYFYTYDTLALFGGLDTNVLINDDFSPVLYGNNASNTNSYRYQLTYNHNANVQVLTTLIPNSKTDLTFYYISTSQKFMQNKDTLASNLPIITNDNYFQTFGVRFRNLYKRESFSLDITANYETSTFEADVIQNTSKQNIISLSGVMKFPLLGNKYFIPSIFAKTNSIDDVNMFGFGGDLSGIINNSISYYAGISWFQQHIVPLSKSIKTISPLSMASFGLIVNEPSSNQALEVGIKFKLNYLNGSLSYFNYSSENSLVPNTQGNISDTLLINELYYFSQENIENSGVNLVFNFKLWKFLFSNNLNYFFSTRDERVYASPDYTLAGKLYYLDKLFNNNFDVKVGINYRFTGGQSPFVYDFEKLLQIKNELTPHVNFTDVPPSFQLDLYMAGTIQKRATIFVTLENLLDTEYYVAPYYFKQPITFRLGVSWLLFD